MKEQGKEEEISKMVSNLIKDLVDQRTIKKLGTSIEQHMSHNYQEVLESKFLKLKNEFLSNGYQKNSNLQFSEIYNFFKSRNPNVKEEEIKSIYDLCGKDKNKKITINEFIYNYLTLEEKLKMKKESLTEVKDSLSSKMKTYQEKIKQYENEQYNSNGISTENELQIHIIELINLHTLVDYSNCKIVINLINKKGEIINEKETRLIRGKSNPKFNEKFLFQIPDVDCRIKFILTDSDNLINEGFAFFSIELSNLYDQLNHDMWIDVEGKKSQCKAHISCCLIYDHTKRYKDLNSKTSQQIDRLTQNIIQIENFLEKMKEPFGLILDNKVHEIFQKKILLRSENVNDYLGTLRISVYPEQAQGFRFSNNESPNKFISADKDEELTRSKLRGTNGLGIIKEEGDGNLINSNLLSQNEIMSTEGYISNLGPLNDYMPKSSKFLGKKSNQLILLGIVLSLLNLMFGKIDIINLVLFLFGFLIIYNLFKINTKINTKTYLFYGLLVGIALDLFWIIFLNRGEEDESSLSRVIVFGLTLIVLIIKIILCYFIKNKRR